LLKGIAVTPALSLVPSEPKEEPAQISSNVDHDSIQAVNQILDVLDKLGMIQS